MTGKEIKTFINALGELEREKGISKEELLETLETAVLAAYKKNSGDDKNVRVDINDKTGELKLLAKKMIVEKTEDPDHEIEIRDALKLKKNVEIGDEIEVEVECNAFKRNAISNAKQIVVQKIRETERDTIFRSFKEREGDLINGIIRRIDAKGNIYIDFNGVEAFLGINEQSASDYYRIGDRLKVYVVEVAKQKKNPKIVISRKHEGLLRKLFEMEIPEVEDGTVEIKSIAREAGNRAKIAVYSDNQEIDTIGACVGQYGARIKSIVNEINGEKIDIINWEADITKFVSNALSPARVKIVELLDDKKTCHVIVDKDQLSLAIGKHGQNARLAARLTGMRVDIETYESVIEKDSLDVEGKIDELATLDNEETMIEKEEKMIEDTFEEISDLDEQ